MKVKILFILTVIILLGCSQTTEEGGNEMHNYVELKTKDNIKIIGDHYKADSNKAIILLHMLSVTKDTWKEFAQELNQKGYEVLAIDFRGHGQSDLNLKDFSEKDCNNMILDVEAAHNFLNKEKTAVIGASIGANIALKYSNNVDTSILLSPGLNYRGVNIEQDSKNANNPILIVVSKEDKYSFDSSQQIAQDIKDNKLITYTGKGHGTNMLDRETKEAILNWLEKKL